MFSLKLVFCALILIPILSSVAIAEESHLVCSAVMKEYIANEEVIRDARNYGNKLDEHVVTIRDLAEQIITDKFKGAGRMDDYIFENTPLCSCIEDDATSRQCISDYYALREHFGGVVEQFAKFRDPNKAAAFLHLIKTIDKNLLSVDRDDLISEMTSDDDKLAATQIFGETLNTPSVEELARYQRETHDSKTVLSILRNIENDQGLHVGDDQVLASIRDPNLYKLTYLNLVKNKSGDPKICLERSYTRETMMNDTVEQLVAECVDIITNTNKWSLSVSRCKDKTITGHKFNQCLRDAKIGEYEFWKGKDGFSMGNPFYDWPTQR